MGADFVVSMLCLLMGFPCVCGVVACRGHGWIQVLSDEFGIKRDKPAVKVIAAFSKRTILFSVQK